MNKQITRTIIIISIVVLALFVYFVFIFKTPQKNIVAPASVTTEDIVKTIEQDASNTAEQIYKTDKDLDGLTDVEEAKYGTSPTSSDTDKDGLTDKDEIYYYKTDPLKSDTDGDGISDGKEVRTGRDPLTKGK